MGYDDTKLYNKRNVGEKVMENIVINKSDSFKIVCISR